MHTLTDSFPPVKALTHFSHPFISEHGLQLVSGKYPSLHALQMRFPFVDVVYCEQCSFALTNV